MLHAFPCLQELTIGSRLSSVAAQQLGVLAAAKQLQVLNIPYAQALQDRSLLVSAAAISRIHNAYGSLVQGMLFMHVWLAA